MGGPRCVHQIVPFGSFWYLLAFVWWQRFAVKSLHLFGVAKVYNTYHWMSSWPRERCAKFDTFHKSVFSSRRLPSSLAAHFLSRSWTRSRQGYSSAFHEYAVERRGLVIGRLLKSCTCHILIKPLRDRMRLEYVIYR